MKKIKSGIYGLNPILDGGINENSTTVVIGCAGAGKTTLATQFIRRGLEDGQEGIFVSLDENKGQIIREAVEMGWPEILDYLDDELLVFIDASGREFSRFIKKELPDFVADWEGANARIAIDPLTPVMWSITDQYEQRELIGFMLKETRKVGTVLCTLEEHGTKGDLSGNETIIPMYLGDCVIHLHFKPHEGRLARHLKVMKCRSSRHSEIPHRFHIIRGLGLVVEQGEYSRSTGKNIPKTLIEALGKRKDDIPDSVSKRLKKAFTELIDDDFKSLPPEEVIADILEEYSEG